MTLVTRAMIFAAEAHDGDVRKGSQTPYIVHPMEAMAIASSLTEDPEVLAAAALHDVAEDCGVTREELTLRFGERVASLVMAESQIQSGDPCASWDDRKRRAVEQLEHASRDEMIIALADKLSNMRAISRDFEREGEKMFLKFHQTDRSRHAWYYRNCAENMRDELGDTEAFRELVALVNRVFKGVKSQPPEFEKRCAV